MSTNHLIYHLRDANLDPKLQYQLASIISAYRPHDEPPKLDELHRERVDKSHCSMVDLAKEIGRVYNTNKK
jgi:hypothetical protein